MGLGDIEAYAYQAAPFCGPCIKIQMGYGLDVRTAEQCLDHLATQWGVRREHESTFDSEIFPKVTLGQDLNDGPWQHCATCGDCLGHDLSDCDPHDEYGCCDEEQPEHADYPHGPGALYDCDACQAQCHCSHMPGSAQCVFCAMLQERHQL